MKQTDHIAKLQQRQQQIAEELRAAKAQLTTRREKQMTRSKLILGDALLSIPSDQRDALLPLVMDHLTERDRQFVSECLADAASAKLREDTSNLATSG